MEKSYYEVNVDNLEIMGDENFINTSFTENDMQETQMQVIDEMHEEVQSSSENSIALYITIGVCAVLGIVLGIILGRKSALK